MMFWLGVAGAVLVAIYLVIVDNKDDFWKVKGGLLSHLFRCHMVWFFCNGSLKSFWYNNDFIFDGIWRQKMNNF